MNTRGRRNRAFYAHSKVPSSIVGTLAL